MYIYIYTHIYTHTYLRSVTQLFLCGLGAGLGARQGRAAPSARAIAAGKRFIGSARMPVCLYTC